MRFYAKVYRVQSEIMVAVCDEDIHGKTFEDGKRILEVKKAFYGKELFEKREITLRLNEATIANLVGSHIIAHAIKIRLIDPSNVIKVKGVPHAQMVRM